MKHASRIQRQSVSSKQPRFLLCFAHSAFPRCRSAPTTDSGARREVLAERHRARAGQGSVFDAHRSPGQTKTSSISPPATRTSGSSTASTTSASSTLPRPASAPTLNLITASGHVYSFLLTEISNEPNAAAGPEDLHRAKRRIERRRTGLLPGLCPRQRSRSIQEGNSDDPRAGRRPGSNSARHKPDEQIEKFRYEYPAKLRFDYQIDKKASGQPFLVSAIYHDDAFTYIQCAAREKPTLYEMKDGKPNLINFQFENGVYIAPKILDSGYLAIGKKKLTVRAAQ